MRIAVARLTEPLFGWIPDITLVPRSRQVAVGVIASIILHALIFCGAMVAMLVFPERFERPEEAPQPNLEVIVQPKPQPEPAAPTPKPERRFVTNEGLKPGEKPKDAQFEADKDMTAASEVPPKGTSDLPGQEGKKAPHMRDFVDQDISLNKTALALRQQKMQPLQPAQSEEQPATVAPLYAPQPLDDKARAAAEKAKPDEKLPEPAKPTRATPSPLEKVKTPSETQIAMAETKPPAPQEGDQPKTQPQTVKSYALATPVPLRATSPSQAYQQQLRKTHNESVISNRGISGVNAVNTPAGRWMSMTNRAFSQNWQLFIHQNPDMVSIGSVRVKFAVSRAGGRPRVVAVEPLDRVSSTTIQACTRAVSETPLAPPPADLFDDENAQKYEDDITFTLY